MKASIFIAVALFACLALPHTAVAAPNLAQQKAILVKQINQDLTVIASQEKSASSSSYTAAQRQSLLAVIAPERAAIKKVLAKAVVATTVAQVAVLIKEYSALRVSQWFIPKVRTLLSIYSVQNTDSTIRTFQGTEPAVPYTVDPQAPPRSFDPRMDALAALYAHQMGYVTAGR